METDTFDPNLALWDGLVRFVAKRDGITEAEAGENLVNLFRTPEVIAQAEADRANSPEARLAAAVDTISAVLETLKTATA